MAMNVEPWESVNVCRSNFEKGVKSLSFCKWILQQVLIRSLQFCAGYLALYIVFNICCFQDSKSVFLLFISLVEVPLKFFRLWSVETWKAVSPLTATFLIDVLCIFSTIRGTRLLQILTPAIHDASRHASRFCSHFPWVQGPAWPFNSSSFISS